MREYGGSPLPAGKYLTILKDGEPVRFEYREIDHCCQNFSSWMAGLMNADCKGGERSVMQARAIRSQDIVEVVTARLRQNENIPCTREAWMRNVTMPG